MSTLDLAEEKIKTSAKPIENISGSEAVLKALLEEKVETILITNGCINTSITK